MTPEYRERLRLALLGILASGGAVGLRRSALPLNLGFAGFDAVDAARLDDALDYLAGKGLAEKMSKTISPELARWKITAAGLDLAAQEGLA
jgi:hypothetical protein